MPHPGTPLLAQENYLVSTEDGWLSLYDLATSTLITSTKLDMALSSVVPGPNNRLAFGPSGDYTPVVDTTIGRETVRIPDANGFAAAMTPDRKLLLRSWL